LIKRYNQSIPRSLLTAEFVSSRRCPSYASGVKDCVRHSGRHAGADVVAVRDDASTTTRGWWKRSATTFRGTGISTYVENEGTLELAQEMANHATPRTNKLYDRRGDKITQDAGERVRIEQQLTARVTSPVADWLQRAWASRRRPRQRGRRPPALRACLRAGLAG
jgi:hypothetical protein